MRTLLVLVLALSCLSACRDAAKGPTTRETWILAFDPPLEVEVGLGPDGIVYQPVTLYPQLDRTGDDVTGRCEWRFSDTGQRAHAGMSGSLSRSRVHLVMRDDGGDLVVLDGELRDEVATGTATFVRNPAGARQGPDSTSRFTLKPSSRAAGAERGGLAAHANQDLGRQWRRAFVEGSTLGYEGRSDGDEAKLAGAARALTKAAELAEGLTGISADASRAITLNNLAACQFALRKFADAERSYLRAAEFAEAAGPGTFGFNDRDAPHAIVSNLILAVAAQQKPVDALIARLAAIDRELRPYRAGPDREVRWLNAP